MPTPFLTTADVAERYRTTAGTVRYWRHVGTGPRSAKFGRRVLYTQADLLAWEDQCREADERAPAA